MTTQNLLAQAPFSGTSQHIVPITPGQFAVCACVTEVDPADVINPALSVNLTVDWSADGKNWYGLASIPWLGAADNTGRFASPPGIRANLPATASSLRITLSVPVSMTIGLDLLLN